MDPRPGRDNRIHNFTVGPGSRIKVAAQIQGGCKGTVFNRRRPIDALQQILRLIAKFVGKNTGGVWMPFEPPSATASLNPPTGSVEGLCVCRTVANPNLRNNLHPSPLEKNSISKLRVIAAAPRRRI